MNKSNVFSAMMAVVLSVSNASALTSRIQHVELYPSGAAVTRQVIVEPDTDASGIVEVSDLPSSVIASSFQISPVGESDLKVGGFTFLPQENPVEEDDPRTAELREIVDKLADQQRLISEEKSAIEDRVFHFDQAAQSIRKSLEEEANSDMFELAQTAWATREEMVAEGQIRLAELAIEDKKLALKIKDARKDLNELVSKLSRKSGMLRFDISGDLSKEIQLLVRYQVREAGWSPVHEIRAIPAQEKLSWIYKARIHQSTGEDWEDVQVSLNSASALYGGGLPPLPPLILNRIEARGSYLRSEMKVMEQSAVDMAPMAARGQAGIAQPASTTTGFFIHLPQVISLESGKEPVVREAFIGEVEADFWSEAVPELSNEAWLMAGMTNELGWPILAGESYSYIDGQLVSRRHMESVASGEEMEFALGRNEKITIERKERVKKESEGGLIDKTKRHNIKYETTVTNQMAVAHRVVLQDRFPIGRDNKIQVRILSPRDVEPEEGTGIFKWERSLETGKKAVLVTEYTVTYPADWVIHPPLD